MGRALTAFARITVCDSNGCGVDVTIILCCIEVELIVLHDGSGVLLSWIHLIYFFYRRLDEPVHRGISDDR